MTVSFSTTPDNVLVPLFYAEMDNSQANTASATQPSLILGYASSTSLLPVNSLFLVSSVNDLRQQAGRGSQLARMAAAYRKVDTSGQLWAIALPEPAAGAAATGELTVTGAAIAAGVISLYVGTTRVQAAVKAADTATAVVANLVSAINALADLPVIAAVSDEDPDVDAVTLTARNKGLCGNEIPLALNYQGVTGGEVMPNGIAVEISAMSAGAGAPDFTAAIAALGDEAADFIALPFNDSASLTAMATAMNDTSGRWAPGRQVYGHVYSAMSGDLADLQVFGVSRNDQHMTLSGFESLTQTCSDELAAYTAARNAVFIRDDPARPTQTGALTGALPAPVGTRFTKTQQQTLLESGIATCYAQAGGLFIQRAITTYQKNAFGDADNSYLDSETLHTSAYVLRQLESVVTSKYPRHKLANDGTRFGPGQAIITPAVAKGEMCSTYRQMELAGIVENFDLFKQYLIVERDANDSNRLNVLFPPDYVNQLRVFAVVNQFRLQYPAQETA